MDPTARILALAPLLYPAHSADALDVRLARTETGAIEAALYDCGIDSPLAYATADNGAAAIDALAAALVVVSAMRRAAAEARQRAGGGERGGEAVEQRQAGGGGVGAVAQGAEVERFVAIGRLVVRGPAVFSLSGPGGATVSLYGGTDTIGLASDDGEQVRLFVRRLGEGGGVHSGESIATPAAEVQSP